MMMVELSRSPEQEEGFLLKMIEAGTLFIDVTFPTFQVPFSSLSSSIVENNVRRATPQDIPQIREFFEGLKLIVDGTAK